MARSAAVVAVCLLLVYLALTPTVLRSVDAVHQQQMAYARDPGAYWASVRQEVDRLKADSDYVKGLREEVEAYLAAEAEREAAAQQGPVDAEDETNAVWLEADVDECAEP